MQTDLIQTDVARGDVVQADMVQGDTPPGSDTMQETDQPKKHGGCSATTSSSILSLFGLFSALLILAALRSRALLCNLTTTICGRPKGVTCWYGPYRSSTGRVSERRSETGM